MLCSRPQEKGTTEVERPYCFRVTPHEDWGLCPPVQVKMHHPKKHSSIQCIAKHKKWLNTFKTEINSRKKDAFNNGIQNELRRIKMNEASQQMRDDIRSGNFNNNPKYTTSLINPDRYKYATKSMAISNLKDMNQCEDYEMDGIEFDDEPENPATKKTEPMEAQIQHSPVVDNTDKIRQKAVKDMVRKKAKPAFAMTEEQAERLEEDECDEQLDFFDNTNCQDYLEDLEVKNLCDSIKKRVEELKQEPEWETKWRSRLDDIKKKKKASEANKNRYVDNDDMQVNAGDGRTITSGGNMFGECTSVASEQTKERVDDLKDKMAADKSGKQQWNCQTRGDEQSAHLETRLAKHIADELLRSNMVSFFLGSIFSRR